MRKLSIISSLRQALSEGGELSLHYQPRIDMRTGLCFGVEALIRWNHPTLGPISPNEFVPLAEQVNLARPLARWVVDAASAQAAAWHKSGFRLRVSINASATNLEEPEFSDTVLRSAARHRVPAETLEVEFTEGIAARNLERIRHNLESLHNAGVTCSIDDFGTGYSALSHLQDLPADTIKIDRSFVRNLREGTKSAILVRHLISMMHDLGCSVVAEGVEKQEAYDLLAKFGCDEAQGYLIARPMPSPQFEAWFEARKSRTAA